MTWFYLSLVSIFGLAAAELLQQKLLGRENFDERTSGVLTFTLQALLTLPAIFLSGLGPQFLSVFHPKVFPFLIMSSVAASIAMIFYLKSFRVKNISISSIFISGSVVVSTILGIIFFKESVAPVKFLGIGLVLLAIVALNFNNKGLEKNHLYGILAGIFFGLTYTFDKFVVIEVSPLIYIFWSFSLVSLFGFILNPRQVIKALSSENLTGYGIMFLSGIFYFVYNLCTFTAYKVGGEVGSVDAINNSQIFLIILVEYFILNQKGGIFRKIVTACIAFTGVFILGVIA